MTGLIEHARWKIAYLLDKLPGQCWTDLVMWAINGVRLKGSPWQPISSTCRLDYERTGACYCGKLRDRTENGAP